MKLNKPKLYYAVMQLKTKSQQTKANVNVQNWIASCETSNFGKRKIYYQGVQYSMVTAITKCERLLGKNILAAVNTTYANNRVENMHYDKKNQKRSRI